MDFLTISACFHIAAKCALQSRSFLLKISLKILHHHLKVTAMLCKKFPLACIQCRWRLNEADSPLEEQRELFSPCVFWGAGTSSHSSCLRSGWRWTWMRFFGHPQSMYRLWWFCRWALSHLPLTPAVPVFCPQHVWIQWLGEVEHPFHQICHI